MAYIGDITTAARTLVHDASVMHVLGEAGAVAAEVGDSALQAVARRPFQLAEHTPETIQFVQDQMRHHLAWVDEGNCYNRAMYGAHLLSQETGIGRSPLEHTFAGAIAVSPHLHDGGTYTGGFHAALAVRVQGRDGVQIIDLLPQHPDLESLASWTRHPEPLLLHPWAGTGLWDGVGYRSTWVGAPYFEDAAARLTSSRT